MVTRWSLGGWIGLPTRGLLLGPAKCNEVVSTYQLVMRATYVVHADVIVSNTGDVTANAHDVT